MQPEDWASKLVSNVGEDCTLVIDESINEAWQQCVEDVELIRKNVKRLLNVDDDSDEKIPLTKIIDLCFGKTSTFYQSFWHELGLDRLTFAKFFGTLSLQMSYKETSGALFDELSSLKDHALIDEVQYMTIWKKLQI